MIGKLWSEYEIVEVSHKYNVANRASFRNRVVEGIIYGN